MENKTSKKPKELGRNTRKEQGEATNKQTVREANPSRLVEDSDERKVFLPFSDDPDIPVYFGVSLHKVNNRFVHRHVQENGLAYAAGFRSGDKLVTVNSKDIVSFTPEALLLYLREYDGLILTIGVERDDTPKPFIWVIFKIVRKEGNPAVEVLHTLVNDTNTMPMIPLYPATKLYKFDHRVKYPVNIYTDGKPPLYLTIGKDEKLTFQTYNANGSVFYQYLYSDTSLNPPGQVVAFSQEKLDDDDSDSYSCSDTAPSQDEGPSEETVLKSDPGGNRKKTTLASTKEEVVKLMDFPKWMTGKEIKANPRFWFQNEFEGEMSLQSMMAKGYYLGMSDKGKAVLKTTPTKLWINVDDRTATRTIRVNRPVTCS